MSVIMTLRIQGDPGRLEAIARDDPERLPAIAERAKRHGVVAHRFYGSEDGRIMVVDEWPDADSFQAFFDESRAEIQAVMDDVGVAAEPEVTFWRKLESGDEVGWTD